jgi:hypothetical protein
LDLLALRFNKGVIRDELVGSEGLEPPTSCL